VGARVGELREGLFDGTLKNLGLQHLGDRAEDFAVKDFLAQSDRVGADGLPASTVVEAGVVRDELTGPVAPVRPGLSAHGSATHAAPQEADEQVG